MEEQSFHERESLADSSGIQRLSESRPKFKPVLVKKLLADESDDDSDDQPANSDNSDDESDHLDGCQPLPEECTANLASATLVARTNIGVNVAGEENGAVELSGNTKSGQAVASKIGESIEVNMGADNDAYIKNTERTLISNLPLKESLTLSDYVGRKSEEDKLVSGAKRKSSRDSAEPESIILQSQWQPKIEVFDKRKSLPVREQSESSVKSRYSPVTKRHSHSVAANQISEGKDRPIQQFESNSDLKDNQKSNIYSSTNLRRSHCVSNETCDDKASLPSKNQVEASNSKTNTAHSTLETSHNVSDTPMKRPQGSTRPNPCLSHRNIFQTPQNKLNKEFTKNPMQQTPATIFSHWSQQHMAQTPMQNQIPTRRESMQSRESMQTPATTCVSQSQSVRVERSRYYSVESKTVRRPLAETMYPALTQAPQLSRLPEVPNESQPSPPVIKDNSNAIIQENLGEKKPIYSSSHTTYETNENKNSNTHDSAKKESHGSGQPVFKSESHGNIQSAFKSESHGNSQPTLPPPENRHSMNSQPDNKPKLDYHGNVYPSNSNIQSSRNVENYENYKSRESQSVHPSVVKQPEPMPPIQYTISQPTNPYNTRQKVITVKGQQYLVLSVIGHGMSCEVVRAQDLSNSDLRAIKCVNLNKMDKDSVQGCLQEICMLDKLKAPCVVHMYSFEVKQPWVHVVMEIGDTDLSRLLKSMLAEKKKIPLTMILYYWTEMLTAVRHIHENGVIHSDLKPANFLLVRGRLKLIDFGIASSINSDMTSVLKNCSIGTLNYVSPEALMDVNAGSDSPNHNVKYKISYKSDVWSLGCILYSLVYGVTPFNHIRQQWGKISAITDPKHKINFPLVNGTEPVPLILIDVMRKCLQRYPKARPSVADLLEIPYLQGNISAPIAPNIPSNILLKIKHVLSDEEWKQFSEMFTKK